MTEPIDNEFADWDWLTSADGRACLNELARLPNEADFTREARRRCSTARAAMLLEQFRLRGRAAKKFSDPTKWLWTPTLLEQATDEATARFVADHYPSSGCVVDMCCGAGSDAVALAARGLQLAAIDASAIALKLAGANLDSHGFQADLHLGRTESFAIPKDAWVHIDPDRRPGGQRTTHLEGYSPEQQQIESIMSLSASGSIKLAPATDVPQTWLERVGQQWIGVDRAVRQLRAWWNVAHFPAGTRSASALIANHWHTLTRTAEQLRDDVRSVSISDQCDAWIGDYDPAIRGAKLSCSLACEIHASLIELDSGYLTASQAIAHPMVTWFRVLDVLSADVKKLRAYMRQQQVGVLEIKQRGTGFDLERLRKELKLEGDQSRTLILYRGSKNVRAVVAERVQMDNIASD